MDTCVSTRPARKLLRICIALCRQGNSSKSKKMARHITCCYFFTLAIMLYFVILGIYLLFAVEDDIFRGQEDRGEDQDWYWDERHVLERLGLYEENRWNDIGEFTPLVYVCEVSNAESCPSEYWVGPLHGSCYKGFQRKKGFQKAKESCASAAEGAHLPTIHSDEENRLVRRLCGPWQECWIGLAKKVNTEEWVWEDGSTATYVNWRPGDPNNDFGKATKACLAGRWDSSFTPDWSVGPTSDPLPSICELEIGTTHVCPERMRGPWNGSCYVVHYRPTPLYEAALVCANTYEGAHLVDIRSEEENLKVHELCGGFQPCWIGLHRTHGVEWKWMNSSAPNYFSWDVGQPDIKWESLDQESAAFISAGPRYWEDPLRNMQPHDVLQQWFLIGVMIFTNIMLFWWNDGYVETWVVLRTALKKSDCRGFACVVSSNFAMSFIALVFVIGSAAIASTYGKYCDPESATHAARAHFFVLTTYSFILWGISCCGSKLGEYCAQDATAWEEDCASGMVHPVAECGESTKHSTAAAVLPQAETLEKACNDATCEQLPAGVSPRLPVSSVSLPRDGLLPRVDDANSIAARGEMSIFARRQESRRRKSTGSVIESASACHNGRVRSTETSCSMDNPSRLLGNWFPDSLLARLQARLTASMPGFSVTKTARQREALTFHCWAVANAVEPEASAGEAVAYLLASLLLPMVLGTAAVAFFYEAITPACSDHSFCVAGDACVAPLGMFSRPSLNPGRCLPCDVSRAYYFIWLNRGVHKIKQAVDAESVLNTFVGGFSFLRSDVEVARSVESASCRFCRNQGNWLESCLARCTEWDKQKRSNTCSFLAQHYDIVWWYPVFLIVLCLIMWSASAINEIENARINYKVLSLRMREVPNACRRGLILFLGRQIFLWRISLVLLLAVGAWGVLMHSRLSASNILLNLIGMLFLTQVGDIVPMLYLDPEPKERVLAVLVTAKRDIVDTRAERVFVRTYVAYLVTVTTVAAALPLHVARMISEEVVYKSCGEITYTVLNYFFVIVTVVFNPMLYYLTVWRADSARWYVKCLSAFICYLMFVSCFLFYKNLIYGLLL
eukprot:GEMP01004684.1.p1 GENE.GEMP01004684.1~~GEMP01004684.1.p1  ORF type:complete len:1074 (+),score=169.01 GEMP01004684.1:317-3538(+)